MSTEAPFAVISSVNVSFNSRFNKFKANSINGLMILPFKTNHRGPAPAFIWNDMDIIDESILFFRPAVLCLRKFKIEGKADTLMVYLYLYYIECCKIIHGCEREAEALNNIYAFARHHYQPIPGSSRFPLNDLIGTPLNSRDEELVRNYLEQLRVESGERFIKAVFRNSKVASKHWTMFRKRRFINRILELNN